MIEKLFLQGQSVQTPQLSATEASTAWRQLASSLVSIIGDSGFKSLFERSLFLSRQALPWLRDCELLGHTDQRFAFIHKNFETKAPDQVRSENSLLLSTFTDILADLIGEELTMVILKAAWVSPTSDLKNGVQK